MGTHPIFESDFDCLTECPCSEARIWTTLFFSSNFRQNSSKERRKGRKKKKKRFEPKSKRQSRRKTLSSPRSMQKALFGRRTNAWAICGLLPEWTLSPRGSNRRN